MADPIKLALPSKKERKDRIKREDLHPTDKKPNIYRQKVVDPLTGKIAIAGGERLSTVKIIDWKHVREMLEVGCDIDEVSGKFGVKKQELRDRCLQELRLTWAELDQECNSTLLYKLRTMQIKKALGYNRQGSDGKVYHIPPDTQMLIHLGKQMLGQSEKLDIKALYAGYIITDQSGEMLDADNEEDLPPGIIDGIAVVMGDEEEDD